jgi:hypothetical protein
MSGTLPCADEIESQYGQIVAIPTPAVASGFSYTYSTSEYWLLRSLCFQMVTDANAANRIVSLDLIDGAGNKIGRYSSGFTQTATLTTVYTFALDIATYGANAAASIGAPTPEIWLHPGAKLTVNVAAVQAGDQISAINLAVDQVYGGSYAA